jgi:hypothetical protein
VALAGVELGASIVHSHNDEPMFTPDGVHAIEPHLGERVIVQALASRLRSCG